MSLKIVERSETTLLIGRNNGKTCCLQLGDDFWKSLGRETIFFIGNVVNFLAMDFLAIYSRKFMEY